MLPTYAPKRVDLAQLYFNAPPPPMGLSAPHQTSGQRLGDYISGKLQGVVGKRFAKKVGALPDYSPIGAATTAFDLGSDLRQGQYGSAAVNAVGTALNAIPDVGPLAKGMFAGKAGAMLHSIIAPLWHGSPHKFEKFALEKIGTGEGAQAYGHGLYFAEHPEVAKQYQLQLAHQFNRIQEPNGTWTVEEVAGRAPPIRGLTSEQASSLVRKEGHLYKVKLDANPEDFLDHDAPIANQPLAMEALRNLDLNKTGALDRTKRMLQFVRDGQELPEYQAKGRELLNAVSNYGENRAAEHGALMPFGIKGVQYLDQGSRGAGQGTKNFVVYDPSIIDILARH